MGKRGVSGAKRVRDEEAIIEMYFKGYTQLQIAEHFNIDGGVVSSVLRRYKLRHSDVQLTDSEMQAEMQIADKGKIKALYKARWSIKDIAADVNLTEQTVRAVLEEG